MKWSSILCISCVTICVEIISLMMNRTNLIIINSELESEEADKQAGNGINKENDHFRLHQVTKLNTTSIKSTIQYNRVKLFSLADKVRSDPRYRVLTYETHRNISNLKLNRRGCRGGKRKQSHLDIIHPLGSNKDNLISINIEQKDIIAKHQSLSISLANVQSVKNKQLILHHYMVESSIDLCVLTETWLRDTEADQAWLQCSSLNNNGFKCFTSNRQNRRGGGLALICRDMYKVTSLGSGQLRSFEFAKWRLSLKHTTLTILAIYHPPQSDQSQATNRDFLDEFTNWVAEYIINDLNVIILGDFNLHVNNFNDDTAMNFIESTQALALEQHVNFSTHTSGNTLDLVFTELFNGLKVQDCIQDDFISDHCIVRCNLNVKRPDIKRKVVSYRKLKDIDFGKMSGYVNINYDADLNGLVEQFDKALSVALDEVAPIQTKLQSVRKSIPWFTDEVKECKQFMRRREKIWRRYKTDGTKTAFTKARAKYKQQLRIAKIGIISTKVIDCGSDTRKLYSLVNGLIGLTKHNPLPDNQTNEELVEEFGSFFMSKISKI